MKPRIIMNAAAWYKIAQQNFKTSGIVHDENNFYIGDIPITIIPNFPEDEMFSSEDATGYPI